MKPALWPVALNVVGIVIALLYGVAGGSGGETTEGVFMAHWATGWITILLATTVLVWLGLRRKMGSRDLALLVVMALVGFLETRLIVRAIAS